LITLPGMIADSMPCAFTGAMQSKLRQNPSAAAPGRLVCVHRHNVHQRREDQHDKKRDMHGMP
jgi:hypothetical protein